jgi:hypothetical protein
LLSVATGIEHVRLREVVTPWTRRPCLRSGLGVVTVASIGVISWRQKRAETAGLIGSDKVEGTNVYDAHGEKIGSIERVMIEKRSGSGGFAER